MLPGSRLRGAILAFGRSLTRIEARHRFALDFLVPALRLGVVLVVAGKDLGKNDGPRTPGARDLLNTLRKRPAREE